MQADVNKTEVQVSKIDTLIEGHVEDFDTASNPKTSLKQLQKLAKHSQPAVVAAVASHPNASAGLLNLLSSHKSVNVRHAVACHPNTHCTTIRTLITDPSKRIRDAAAVHPGVAELAPGFPTAEGGAGVDLAESEDFDLFRYSAARHMDHHSDEMGRIRRELEINHVMKVQHGTPLHQRYENALVNAYHAHERAHEMHAAVEDPVEQGEDAYKATKQADWVTAGARKIGAQIKD